jgi:hypothetical protein
VKSTGDLQDESLGRVPKSFVQNLNGPGTLPLNCGILYPPLYNVFETLCTQFLTTCLNLVFNINIINYNTLHMQLQHFEITTILILVVHCKCSCNS